MDNLAVVVNTHSSYSDIWPMFFGEFNIYFTNIKTYTFTNLTKSVYQIPIDVNVLYYNNNDCFRDQYLSCLSQVTEKYVITMNDDYLLYNFVDFNKIKEYITILEETDYSFVRFTSADDNHIEPFKKGLYKIPFYNPNIYSQTASLWKTRVLEQIHQEGPALHIGTRGDKDGHFENSVGNICMTLGIQGLACWNGEPKRGISHYDNNVVPYIASALIRGKWNTKEYPKELIPLIKKYNVDINIRGAY
jgi:hypothetical protein